MSDKKITSMVDHKNAGGMAHLIEQANGGEREQKQRPGGQVIPEWPKDKCLKMRCILEGIDYYIPDGQGGFMGDDPPYFPFAFPVGYSVVREGMKVVAIMKHSNKRFFQTGITTEIADLPDWWERRDSGM